MTGHLSVARGPLRSRPFRLWWIGQTTSFFGDSTFPVALTLAVLTSGGSAGDLGLVLGASTAGQVLFMLVGGVWSDRLPRQRIMLAADAIRFVAHALIGFELISGHFSVAHLALAAFVSGTATAFFLPAADGLITLTVPRDQLHAANSLVTIAERIVMVAGPGVATGLTVLVGAGWAIVLDSLTYVVSVVMLSQLHIKLTPRSRAGFLRELGQGWREVRSRTWLWSNVLGHGTFGLARCAYLTVGAALVVGASGEAAWGIVVQSSMVGALIGALLVFRIRPRRPLLVANLCYALGVIPLLLMAGAVHWTVIAAGAAFMNAGVTIMGPLWRTTVVQHVPEEVLSRVKAFDWLISLGLTPMGMAVAAPIAGLVGTRACLLGAAALMLLATLGPLAIPQVRQLNATPAKSL